MLRTQACVTGDAFLDVTPELSAGVHTVVFDPMADRTGSAVLTLYDVPADITGSITPGGAAVPVTIASSDPGRNASLTFAATDQQRVSLNVASSIAGLGGSCTAVTIKRPDGSTVVSNSCVTTSGAFIDVQTLSPAGNYTIAIDPGGAGTGAVTLTLYNVPADVTGTLTVNGAWTPVTMGPPPGQNASFTFSGTSGQLVTVRVQTNNLTPQKCVTVKLLRQNQTQLTSLLSCSATFNLTQQSLPATEPYYVKIDPSGVNVGTLSVKVTNP